MKLMPIFSRKIENSAADAMISDLKKRWNTGLARGIVEDLCRWGRSGTALATAHPEAAVSAIRLSNLKAWWSGSGRFILGKTVAATLLGLGISLLAEPLVDLKQNSEGISMPPGTLAEVLSVPSERLGVFDIARLNLLCADGLPGAGSLDVGRDLDVVAEWSKRVEDATIRNRHRFREHPEQFENSEPFFRMLVLITVLQRDLKVGYNDKRISIASAEDSESGSFFLDSRDLFLHGLLRERRTGTCASMPVLYVAVGRRLGYPLKLVCAKSHLFVRWQSVDGKERLNIEGSSSGLNTHPDEFYRNWPLPITETEIQTGQYLKNLTPSEEVAEFLVVRACCLAANGRKGESKVALQRAHELAPHCARYLEALNQVTARERSERTSSL